MVDEFQNDDRVERAVRLVHLAVKAREVGLFDRADELTRLAAESYKQAGSKESSAFGEAE